MKNTGLLLKTKRESSGLSLSEVALATKINPKILNAIENGDESALPARTFLKGFVRSYAVFLKMDVDEVMRSYNEEMSPPPPPVKTEVPSGEATKTASDVPAAAPSSPAPRRRVDEEESSKGFRTALVAVIVVLIGMIIGVRELIEKYQREKVVEVPQDLKVSPLVNAPTPQPEEKKEDQAPPAETKVAEELKKPEEVKPEEKKPEEVKPDEKKPEEHKAEEKKAEEKKAEEKKPEEKVADQKKPEEKKEEIKPEEKPADVKTEAAAPTGQKNEIILEALDNVDVKLQLKGETKRISLAANQVHTIRTDAPITLDFSDGGAVNIIFNGRERGVPGDLGKPKTVKIP